MLLDPCERGANLLLGLIINAMYVGFKYDGTMEKAAAAAAASLIASDRSITIIALPSLLAIFAAAATEKHTM